MKVGNVEVLQKDNVVQLNVHTGHGWTLYFKWNAHDKYHAELVVQDVYKGLSKGRIEMQREIVECIERQAHINGTPGGKRGKLKKLLNFVREIYSL